MRAAICRVEERDVAAQLGRASELDAWSVRFGDQLLLYAANSKWKRVAAQAERRGLRLKEHPDDVKKGDMYLVVQKGRLFQQEYPDVTVLLDKGRYLAVVLTREQVRAVGTRTERFFGVQPLKANTVVFDVRPPPTVRAAPADWIQNLVNRLAIPSFGSDLTHLVLYPTRYSTSSHYSDAAAWCQVQLNAMCYHTRLETISVGGSTSRNLVADKRGVGSSPRDLVLVVAHLDSINLSGSPTANAPGADDNGSGSAAVLEIARALKCHTAVHDLRLVLFGGEEQGLMGSQQYVSGLPTAERERITAVINMDMIGTLNTAAATVLLEGAPVSQTLIDDLESAATTYTPLIVQTSLNPFASDHVPFIDAGLPAVLTIEGTDSANSNVHTANDTLAHIDYDLALQIMKTNIALVAAKLDRVPTIAVTTIAECCLNKTSPISLREDIFGVYGDDNPQTRSLRDQLDLIQNSPFVRVALVTIQGANPPLQRDLDNANVVYQDECDAWVYPVGSITVNRPALLILDQDDCSGNGHSVSDEEDELFDLGRGMGADVVAYYVNSSSGGFAGCAAHPPGRRGFWVGSSASPWTFAHELTHVVGDNSHVSDSDNLMSIPTASITNPPPDLTDAQCNRIHADPDMERC